MKIPNIKGLVSIAKGMLDPQKAQVVKGKPGTKPADKVELSSESQEVQKIAAQRPDQKGRAAMVAELKAQHDRGELKADSKAVAEAMVADGMFDDLIKTE